MLNTTPMSFKETRNQCMTIIILNLNLNLSIIMVMYWFHVSLYDIGVFIIHFSITRNLN